MNLPIRLKLTLPFAVGMALLVAAMGWFIYTRVGGELLSSVDQSLNVALAESAHHVGDVNHPLIDPDVNEGPRVAQVILRDGTVASSSSAAVGPVLGGSTLQRAFERPLHTTNDVKGLRGDWRLASEPVRYRGAPAVLVVGRSLSARTETLGRLSREFLIAAPIVAVLTILAGYALTAGALRPVEAMRRRAAAIGAATPGRRLPVPAAKDELSALATTLNEMLARLEGALEHERRFVADASHELRTPLALLRTELEVALRRPRSHDELEAALRSAAEETERLVRLAEDLLLIARADEGALPIRREEMSTADLLERVRGRFAGHAESIGREVRVEPSNGLVVDADPARIDQALGNLVDNALQHGAGPVTLAAHAQNGHVELHVTDEGTGFPEQFVARAFDRFSRADEARSAGGTGLGLAIVTLIASAHGGSAHAANRPQGGADVWLQL
jgi:heavy metal sensor kinase